MHILIVEDDTRLGENLQKILKEAEIVSTIVATGEDALYKIDTETYDLIILDWMLPDVSGIEVCKKVRERNCSSPILMLTAKSQIEDKVEGLTIGADDYLTKPFAKEELLARINVLIRRKTGKTFSTVLKAKDLSLNTSSHEVKRGNKIIDLAPREYALLEYMLLNKGQAIDRITLLHHVWGEAIDTFSNTVDVHVRYLRKKIDKGFKKKLIRSVRGFGYSIR